MVINLLAAALAGILVPLTLDRFDIDPAIASGTFVTKVTDVVGFSRFWDWRRSGFCEGNFFAFN